MVDILLHPLAESSIVVEIPIDSILEFRKFIATDPLNIVEVPGQSLEGLLLRYCYYLNYGGCTSNYFTFFPSY